MNKNQKIFMSCTIVIVQIFPINDQSETMIGIAGPLEWQVRNRASEVLKEKQGGWNVSPPPSHNPRGEASKSLSSQLLEIG